MGANQEMLARMDAKTEVNLKERKEGMLAKMYAWIVTTKEKSEVLQNTLVSRMDAHQARREDN
jgi:hypothetical protein